MRPRCNFIFFTLLFTFCPLARVFGFPDKCCFSFSKRRIPVRLVESYHHVTHPVCKRGGIVLITKAQREICADPTERWVQRLKNLVDRRNSPCPIEKRARPETAVTSSKVDRVAKKNESFRTSETATLQRPEETTLVHLTDSNDWLDFDTTQANPNTEKTEPIRTSETAPLQRPEETTLVHLTDSNDWLDFDTTQANPNTEMASESVGTRGRTRIQRADESAVVHLKESAYFCMQPEGE